MGPKILPSSVAMRGLLLLLSIAAGCQSMSVYSGSDYTESNCYDKKQAIVHLFEWHWDWIADECEKVLGPKGFCGNGWTCEHRWSSIMNMAQFANKVIGQPVTNWDASGTT